MLDMTEALTMSQRSNALKDRFFELTPAICLEAAVAKTAVYQETEGEEEIIRRAKSFLKTCEDKTIGITPLERVVGNAGRTGRCAVIHPELAVLWLNAELDTISTRDQDPYAITEEEKQIFREEIYPYWKGKTVEDHFKKQLPPDTLALLNVGGVIDSAIKYKCVPGPENWIATISLVVVSSSIAVAVAVVVPAAVVSVVSVLSAVSAVQHQYQVQYQYQYEYQFSISISTTGSSSSRSGSSSRRSSSRTLVDV